MRVMRRAIAALIGLFWLLPMSAQATLMGILPCSGANACTIAENFGDIPNPVSQDPNNGILLAWDEVQNFTLTANLAIDRVRDPGSSVVIDISGQLFIKAGTIVSSHYLQWDPGLQSSSTVEATIELDSEIFGFIFDDDHLEDSDAQLGLPGIDYNDFNLRGIESGDTTVFNASDPNKVDIDWFAGTPGDWTRLITAFSPAANVPEPGSLGVFGLGIIGIGLVLRRRRNKR